MIPRNFEEEDEEGQGKRIIYEDDEQYYVLKLPLLSSRLIGLRDNEIFLNEGLWGAFRHNKLKDTLEPIKYHKNYFDPIPYRRVMIHRPDIMRIYRTEKEALRETQRLNNTLHPKYDNMNPFRRIMGKIIDLGWYVFFKVANWWRIRKNKS